ncbi:MAG: hypothetical protein M1133_10770 [Armatimonadetes bacterium]|nr:hypothetical protein [Armatimonadota bacterium]
MKSELMTCRRLTAGIVFPPYQLHQQQVNRIYADITERYPYQTLQHLPDGARMANPNGDFFIQTTRMQTNEAVDYFQSSKEKTLDLFNIAQDKLNITQFLTFGIKLTAFIPVDGKLNAAQLIESTALGAIKDNIELLGPGRQGVGLRFVLHQDGVHELKIEPFFGDLKQLYVELDVQHPAPFADLALIESRMDAAYDYLFREVSGFLETL